MNSEDDRNEKEKKYDEYLLNWENLRKEFEQNKLEEEKRKSVSSNEKNKKKEKGQPQKMQNNLLYNFINNSKYHKGNLTLLSEKQEFDENEKFQKLVDLLYEENETVPDIQLIDREQDDYFITQLYTTFSLLSRNVYLDLPGNEKKNEKLRSFLQSLNNVNYDSNKVLNNQTLHMINHNILRPEKYFKNLALQNSDEKEREKMIIKQNELRIQREKELKKKLQIQREKEKLLAIKSFRGDNLTIEPKFKNIKEKNESIQRDKLSKIAKIIDMNDKYLSEMSKKEFDKIFNDIYYGKTIDLGNSSTKFNISNINEEYKLKEDYEFWESNCKSYREKYGFFQNDNMATQSFKRKSLNK